MNIPVKPKTMHSNRTILSRIFLADSLETALQEPLDRKSVV